MKRFLFVLVVLFVLASCQKEDSTYYVQEIIRLEHRVFEAEYQRDIYKAKLEKYVPADYLLLPDTSTTMSLSSIKTFVRFYPN